VSKQGKGKGKGKKLKRQGRRDLATERQSAEARTMAQITGYGTRLEMNGKELALARPPMFADAIAESLCQAALANPNDSSLRLILADRLSEIGEEDRAEFIRIGIELAAIERGPTTGPCNWCQCNLAPNQNGRGRCSWCKCRKRFGELHEANPKWWRTLFATVFS